MKFKLANKTLANSDIYESRQQKLLTAEIEEKERIIKNHKNNHQVNPIVFAHICSIFSIYNDKNIPKCKEVQDR